MDNSYLYLGNSLLSFEDFGFSQNSSIKEFWYKNLIYSNFFNFNILNFYSTVGKFLYFNESRFFFFKPVYAKNFKFWDFDTNVLLFQNTLFQQNVLLHLNKMKQFNLTYLYLWPSLIYDLNNIDNNKFD